MRTTYLALGVVTLVTASVLGAQETGSPSSARPTAATTAQKSPARPARGPLPDPALLDGSTQSPEKKPEYGMLGEFEIPGDENAKSGKVGGQQPPPGAQSGGGGQPDPKASQQQGGGGATAGMPQMPQGGGSAGGQPSESGQPPKNGGASGTSGPAGGKNDPNASASGIQVAEIKTDEISGPATQAGMPEAGPQKPTPVAIGDPSMQIKPAASAAGVIGATTAGNTQQMEKPTGGGAGKGGASGDNGNKGVEKGRVMPAGL